jgi:hypothetical protein
LTPLGLDSGPDPHLVGELFDAWCEHNMLPWVADDVAMDTDAVRRWEGVDVDPTRRLPSKPDPRRGRA